MENDTTFDALEWGYLIMFYVMLTIIRAIIFFGAYPLTKRIGLGTCWQETIFQIHGGLRGAVGITLALSLNAQVSRLVADGKVDPVYEDQTRKVFGFIGGIAFITLVVNAPTCKPLLLYLNLTESSETREKILRTYRNAFRKQAIAEMVDLLSQPRFKHVNFSFIEHHISFLSDLSRSELMEAVARRKATTLPEEYSEPHLTKILPHLEDYVDQAEPTEAPLLYNPAMTKITEGVPVVETQPATLELPPEQIPSSCLIECRALFLDIIRSAYDMEVSGGELLQRLFLTVAQERSLDLANDQLVHGKPLSDWTYVNALDPALVKFDHVVKGNKAIFACFECISPGIREKWKQAGFRLNVERAMAFMAAHRYAQEFFHRDFEDADPEISAAAKTVVQESKEEWLKAEKALNRRNQVFVERAVSHKFCCILLNSSIVYIGKLVAQGLLREQEAEEWVEEVEKELDGVNKCHRGHGIRARQCSNMSETMGGSGRMRQSSSMSDLLNTSRHRSREDSGLTGFFTGTSNTKGRKSRESSGLTGMVISGSEGSAPVSTTSDALPSDVQPDEKV